ncbi:reverse transcriptase [Hordeum vulgare]|nr:reverse transcriptase [Hordeum vulgare]
MFEKDLMVVEDYDPGKRLEDYDFNKTPIWVRIFNLPLGMMNAEAAQEIGNIVGNFVEADVGMDGSAMGKFLRVKIRMKLDKPIMRGFTLDDEEHEARKRQKRSMKIDGAKDGEDGAWCRFEYEFLPDFCYICGFVGHGEKACSIKLAKGEKAQFGGWLRADMGRRKLYGEEEGTWRGRGRGAGGTRSYSVTRSYEKSGSGSDSLSWQKDGSTSTEGKLVDTEKGEEVTSPSKLAEVAHRDLGRPTKLFMVGQAAEGELGTTREGVGGKHVQVELVHSSHAEGMKKNHVTPPGNVCDE